MGSSNLTPQDLASIPAFSGLSLATLERILREGEVHALAGNSRISALNRRGAENYFLVVKGRLVVTVERRGATGPKVEHLGSFSPGGCFSDGFLDAQPAGATRRVDCSAHPNATVIRADSQRFSEWLRADTTLWQRLAQGMANTRYHFLSQREPARRLVQDFYLRHGYDGGGTARVGQTDLCLDCQKCEEACAKRFGTARMSRTGPVLGRITFHQVCRECVDRPCLEGCKPGAIGLNAEGMVAIDSGRCTGCGICARKCPHRAIQMIEAVPGAVAWDAPGAKRRLAIKCDHCAGYTDMACLKACPTGALIEVSSDVLFKENHHDPRVESNFTGVPFLEGVREHLSRSKRGPWSAAGQWALFLTLVGVVLESFFRRAMPEFSLAAQVYPLLGWNAPVTFSSGKGFGHWLGYVGTGAMLLTLLYPLHTRCGVWKSWGTQTHWLSVHLWVGFIGATLVTCHSMLKLDRWAGLSCIAMWIVVGSGAIGRYLFGLVHSGIGLVEFERSALRQDEDVIARHRTNSQAVRVLTADLEQPTRHQRLLVVMVWLELRDAAMLRWLRWFGLRHIPSPTQRKQIVRFLADWAAHRRNRHYLESAEEMLRHWGWVHIILTIVMFAIAGIHITYGLLYKAV